MQPFADQKAQIWHTPAKIADIERQIRWENRIIDRGVRRYHEIARETNLADQTSGVRIMQEVLPDFITSIKAAQQVAISTITGSEAGRPTEWHWLIGNLSAEQLAVLTLRSALAINGSEASTNRNLLEVCRSIGKAVWDQVCFEDWAEEEDRLTKEARERGEDRLNLHRAIMAVEKTMNRRRWQRLSSKLKLVRSEPWTTEQCALLGSFLVDLLIEHGKGWFQKVLRRNRAKTVLELKLSPEALKAIDDMNTFQALASPFRYPMICPPKPWTFNEETE